MCWPHECRPGRLDKLLYVPLPGLEARVSILRTQMKRTPLCPDVDLQSIGQSPRIQGFSGADLAALVREASVLSLKVHVPPTEPSPAEQSCSANTAGVAYIQNLPAAWKKCILLVAERVLRRKAMKASRGQ